MVLLIDMALLTLFNILSLFVKS